MVWILLGIFIGIPTLILGGAAISVKIDEIKEKENRQKKQDKENEDIYNRILQTTYTDKVANIKGAVKELPQMTFDRWLTFYNTNPDNWDMEKFTTHLDLGYTDYNYLIPTYYKTTTHKGNDKVIKNTVGIPIFWTDWHEAVKFHNWYVNEYKKGNAAGYEKKRDASMEQLAKFLQEDIEERRAKILQDYEKVVDQTQRVNVENSKITLDLNAPAHDKSGEEEIAAIMDKLLATSGGP